MERFNLKKLHAVEGKEQFCVVSNRFAALEDLEINSAWETFRENIKISAKESLGYFELKKHKPWFDEGCHNYYIKGNKLNCSGYRSQVK
jgi:hypothetical protein